MTIRLFELLLIPLVLLLIGFFIEKSISDRQEDLVVTQMVDNYFSGIANQLTLPTEISSSVMIARTRTLLFRLEQLDRKNEIVNVLRFIFEVSPEMFEGDIFEQDPQSEKYFVDLSNIQLSKTTLKIIEISGLKIWNSKFEDTYFYNFSCKNCGFNYSSFKNAKFINVDFEGSDFSGANFTNSNIEDAYIEMANFNGATWSDGRTCSEKSIGKCN